MTDRASGHGVGECFTELFGYVAALRQVCARAQPGFDDVKSRLDGMIEESARRMREWGLDPRDYDDARFAVFAWVDEAVLNMPWTHREAWKTALLQSTYYRTTSAGSEFFDRLNRLRDDQQGVREVYFTCLSLGFRGRYHQEGDAFLLTQLQKSNLKALVGNTDTPGTYADRRLFPSAYNQANVAVGEIRIGVFDQQFLVDAKP